MVGFGAGNISEYFGGYFCSARIRRLGNRVVDGADVPSLDVHYAYAGAIDSGCRDGFSDASYSVTGIYLVCRSRVVWV